MLPGSGCETVRGDRMRRPLIALLALAILAGTAARVLSAEPRKLIVYAPNTTYSLDLADHNGADYVGLVELLEPLGKVEARPDGKAWVLDFSTASKTVRARFRNGKKDVDLSGHKIRLGSDFFAADGRGYVPIDSMQELVTQITGMATIVHPSTRHLYLGNAVVRYAWELRKNPSRLVLSFTAPVAPKITAEGNALKIEFARDPVLSGGSDTLDLHDPAILSATFAETPNGAEFAVRGSAPMVVNSSEAGRVLTVSTQAPAAAVAATSPVATGGTSTSATTATPNPSTPPAQPAAPARPAFLVVIDAAHGGEDLGATLAPKIFEKDLTLALSRRIAHELQNRGIQVMLLRNSDFTLGADQRAVSVNTSHAAIYVAVHASSVGHGVRLFTSLMPPTPVTEGNRAFVAWDAAQSQYLDRSSALSGSIAFEGNHRQLAVKALQGAVLPLKNIAAAAVAVEMAPNHDGIESLSSPEYAQEIAIAVANGIAALRTGEGEKNP